MKLTISPYIGVRPIRLGMTRDEVRATLGSSVREFQKSALSKCKTDAFQDWGLHVYYNDEYLCEIVELHTGMAPILHGLDLLSTDGDRDGF